VGVEPIETEEHLMPPLPKHQSVRARRNKSVTRATLSADHEVKAPPLPEVTEWHPLTKRWWDALWLSPMAPEYAEMDIHGLYRVAMLMNEFWTAETPRQRAEMQLRLEKADADFGTSPLARRRLEWQIEATEDSKAKGSKRRGDDSPPPATRPDSAADPRMFLISST